MVQPFVVSQVDKDLGSTRVRSGHCKRERAALVALLHGIVRDGEVAPAGGDFRVAIDAELRDEVRKHAEKPGVIVEPLLDEPVKALGALRGPGLGDLDHEWAFAGIEDGTVGIGHGCGRSGFSRGFLATAASEHGRHREGGSGDLQ